MNLSKKTHWYDNKLVVFLAIFLFLPIGLYALYKNQDISKWVKIPVFGFFGLLAIGIIFEKEKKPTHPYNLTDTIDQLPPPKYDFAEKGTALFDANGNKVQAKVVYTFIDEQIDDTPLKTQITWHILVEGTYKDRALLRELLTQLYQRANSMNGFKNYNPASHYQIILYDTEKKAKRQNGDFVALLNKMRNQEFDYKFAEELPQ
jgi:hypothetical protein